jgi:hypothetical protein
VQRSRVDEPNAVYDSLSKIWKKCRAFSHSQQYVKDSDISVHASNYLIPFSPSMNADQYAFFKAEAELPGITNQFIAIITGGLLRKPPQIEYNKEVPEDAKNWILSDITSDGGSLVALMDSILKEEMQTSRAWLYVDYPNIDEESANAMAKSDWDDVRPYVVLWQAEAVINWQTTIVAGKRKLSRVIVRGYVEKFNDPLDFHPQYIDTIWVHEVIDGLYQIRTFEDLTSRDPVAVGGQVQTATQTGFTQVGDVIEPKMHGERMSYIPAFPANGSIECFEPYINTFVDKEQALYNVMSRRNHLLYGAATYTPWIASDMPEGDFNDIVSQGLGTWIRLRKGDTIGSLSPPTEALKDLEAAIAAKLNELAKLGMRFLAPETAASGVALDIRSASQVATLGTFNTKISEVMSTVIVHMLNRRYDLKLEARDVVFSLSPDFDPVAIGVDYIRLMTEIYEKNLLPRSEWLRLLKANELLSPEYNDEDARTEINEDELVQPNAAQAEGGMSTAAKLKAEQEALRLAEKETESNKE